MAIETISIRDFSGNEKPVSADLIGTDYVQVFKLGVGADGSLTLIAAGQTTKSASLPVVLPTDMGDLAVTLDGETVGLAEIWATKTRVSKRVTISAGTTGGTVWTPGTDKKFVLIKAAVSLSVAGTIQLFDATDSGNTVIGPQFNLAVNGGYIMDWPVQAPYRSAAANNVLKYTSGAGVQGTIYVEGWEE